MPLHMDVIREFLKIYQDERPGITLDLHEFFSAEELIAKIDEGFDTYLLDVIMPETDGIALAQLIRLKDVDVPIIFITQSDNHALDAFGVSAAQYIVKPIKKESLFSVMDKIIAAQNRVSDNFISVSAHGRVVTLLHSSIVVVENSGRALRFHLDTGEIIDSKAIRTTFSSALSALLDDKKFLWVHQSYVVNMNHVKELRSRMFIMKNGMEITVPRPKFAAVKKDYLKYVAGEK
jgi:DNA-binding LytR/AlgR family response regulator